MSDEVQGLTVVFTGDGKGKTSAAMGVVFRALGHGMKCRVVQFIKGTMDTGEIRSAEAHGDSLEIVRVGKGFTNTGKHTEEEHKEAAQDGLMEAEKSLDGSYGVVVLDEILYALGKGLVTLEDIFWLIKSKPETTHLVFTGRGAPQELIDIADMVTEMKSVKHPYSSGIPAQKGLDY